MMRTVALVAPALDIAGGVPAVADFLRRCIERSPNFRLGPVISLATGAGDPASTSLRRPATLLAAPGCREFIWQGVRCTHVGAYAGELEFQRFRPRRGVRERLAGVDVVQVVAGSPAWANAVAGCGRPVALQVATLAAVERRLLLAQARGMHGAWRRLMTRVTDRLDRRAMRIVDAVQVENDWMRSFAEQSCRPGTLIDYAPPGVDTVSFYPIAREAVALDRSGYLLAVGRMSDPRKNAPLLLESYAHLVACLAGAAPRLVLAGASAPPESFWRRADALGLRDRIVFRASPSRAELVDLYQHAACFVLSSDEEGFGVVLIEAMACGVPVVATRCGGPEGIVNDGVDGFLVGLHAARDMAGRIKRLIGDRATNVAMGAAARERAHATFSEEATGRVYERIWARLCGDEFSVAPTC